MVSPRAFDGQNYQEPYVRRREHPYFKDLMPSNTTVTLDSHRTATDNHKISRSISDIVDSTARHDKTVPSTSENFNDDATTFESFDQSSKLPKRPSFAFHSTISEPNDQDLMSIFGAKTSTARKTFAVNTAKVDLSSIPIPQSAASFYSGISPQLEVVELSESVKRLNLYLKERKHEVGIGVPGQFLRAVIGQDVADVGSIASTIMYAFYLNETQSTDWFCTVPVINMKRTELSSHAQLKWLLGSCQIDQTSLLFIDEVDLSYYDLFGGLKLVLLNGHTLPPKQETLKESVVEILTTRSKGGSAYPWVETVTETEDSSCCTFIAEKFALTSPEILVGIGFSRLLLAGILWDSGNLSNSTCSTRDRYMATLLINSAGRLGFNGLYQILKYKKHDISDLTVIDILRKDFKRWARPGKPDNPVSRLMVSHIGMSSIGISLAQLLAHEATATQEISYFQQSEKLRLLMIVSGYNDSKNNFKREILVSAESFEQMKNLLSFFNTNATYLPLKVLHRPDLREEMRAFEIDKVTSRKTIERLLEEFGGTSKGKA